MARIRTIKPEFWSSRSVVECSTNARLLFVGLWNFSDDGGVHQADAKRLKMEIFPGDDFSVAQIEEWVSELLDEGLIREFEAEGKRWYVVTNWEEHQRIDKPKPRHPQPEDGKFLEHSESVPRTICDRSPLEGKGRETEGKGREKEVCTEQSSAPASEFTFPTMGKGPKEWTLPLSKLEEYQESFPGVDVASELRKARQWCRDNPTKRKTPRGMAAFLTRWLGKVQNTGGRSSGPGLSMEQELERMTI